MQPQAGPEEPPALPSIEWPVGAESVDSAPRRESNRAVPSTCGNDAPIQSDPIQNYAFPFRPLGWAADTRREPPGQPGKGQG
jgi:hypothetical protein